MPRGAPQAGLALDAAVGLALSAAFAFSDTSFMAVPTRAGPWLGMMDPPAWGRVALAVAAAFVAAWSLRRAPRELKKPLLASPRSSSPSFPSPPVASCPSSRSRGARW